MALVKWVRLSRLKNPTLRQSWRLTRGGRITPSISECKDKSIKPAKRYFDQVCVRLDLSSPKSSWSPTRVVSSPWTLQPHPSKGARNNILKNIIFVFISKTKSSFTDKRHPDFPQRGLVGTSSLRPFHHQPVTSSSSIIIDHHRSSSSSSSIILCHQLILQNCHYAPSMLSWANACQPPPTSPII